MGVLNSQRTDISYLLLLCWCLIAEVLISDRLRFRSCDLFVFWPEDPRLFVIWVISLWGPLWARNPPPGGGDSSAGTCSWKSCAPGGKNGSLQRWWPGREWRRAVEQPDGAPVSPDQVQPSGFRVHLRSPGGFSRGRQRLGAQGLTGYPARGPGSVIRTEREGHPGLWNAGERSPVIRHNKVRAG